MRPSLEALGRFNIERSTTRFKQSFCPANTRLLFELHLLVGFSALTHHSDHLHLNHLYIAPAAQGRGLGAWLLDRTLREAGTAILPVRLIALRASPANAFYLRHGFRVSHEDEWDIHYERGLCST